MLRACASNWLIILFLFANTLWASESENCDQLLTQNSFSYEELVNHYTNEGLSSPEDITVDQLIADSIPLQVFYNWLTATDRGVFYDAIISLRTQKLTQKEGKHLSEAYGVSTLRDLKRMYRYLDEIPEGDDFILTEEMLNTAHAIGNKTQKRLQQALSKGPLRPLAGILFSPGEYKKRRNQLSIANGVTKEQYENLLGKLDEFIELGIFKNVTPENRRHYELKPSLLKPPKLVNGTYYGWLLYPDPKIVKEAVQDILDWANFEMRQYREGIESAKDPVFVATAVKQALVYIHPWVDGNGRITKGIRDKILSSFGLLKEQRIDMYHDIDLTVEQDYQLTKLGLARRVKQLAGSDQDAPQTALDKHGLQYNNKDLFEIEGRRVPISYDSYPEDYEHELYLVGHKRQKEFILSSSGFFQDYTGVAYTVVPGSLDSGKPRLVPVADANLAIYGMGGKRSEEVNRAFGRHRGELQNKLAKENIKLAHQLVLDPDFGANVTLEPYAVIEKANDEGRPHFYDWELSYIPKALRIESDPIVNPEQVLVPFASEGGVSVDTTVYENMIISSNRDVSWDHIFAQAQRLDIYYARLSKLVKKQKLENSKEIQEVLLENRRKLHTAVRVMLKDLFPQLKALFESTFEKQDIFKDPEAWRYLRQERIYIGMYQYIKQTHFWYEDFEKGLSKFSKNHVMLLRSSSSNRMKKLGLMPEAWFGRNIEEYLPIVAKTVRALSAEINLARDEERDPKAENLEGAFAKWAASKIFENKKYRMLISSFKNAVLTSPYNSRGLEIEFQRELYLMILHWENANPKEGVSLTTSPGLLFNQYGAAFGSHVEDTNYYVVKIPIDNIRVALASSFGNEYEVTIMDPVFNIANLRPGFVKYESQQAMGNVWMVHHINESEAKEAGVEEGDFNYVVLKDTEEIPFEVQKTLVNFKYYLDPDTRPTDEQSIREAFSYTEYAEFEIGVIEKPDAEQ